MNQNLMADVEGRPSDGVMEKKGRGGGEGVIQRISAEFLLHMQKKK